MAIRLKVFLISQSKFLRLNFNNQPKKRGSAFRKGIFSGHYEWFSTWPLDTIQGEGQGTLGQYRKRIRICIVGIEYTGLCAIRKQGGF
jgi:hypothetical protein